MKTSRARLSLLLTFLLFISPATVGCIVPSVAYGEQTGAGGDGWERVYREYVDSHASDEEKAYMLLDLNVNGIPELYVLDGYGSGGGEDYKAFECRNGELVEAWYLELGYDLYSGLRLFERDGAYF